MPPERYLSVVVDEAVWPVDTARDEVLARVERRAASLRRRRRLSVAPAALLTALFLVGVVMPDLGRPASERLRQVPPADGADVVDEESPRVISGLGGGGLPPGVGDQGDRSRRAVTPTTAAPSAGAMPGPFMPSRKGPSGQLAVVRDGAVIVMNADGTDERVVATKEAGFMAPHWSPDGRRLTVTHLTRRIAVLELDGSWRFVSGVGLPAYSSRWSPDGSRILYLVQEPNYVTMTEGHRVWSVRPDGSDAREVVSDGSFADWAWRGSRVVYNCPRVRLCESAADGSGERVLSEKHVNARVSPDGKRLLATHLTPDALYYATLAPDGTDERFLADGFTSDVAFEWSWDSEWITFLRVVHQPDCTGVCNGDYSVWAMRWDGTGLVRLTSGPYDTWHALGPPPR